MPVRGYKVAFVVQARLGSTRLPGKNLKLLAGKRVIDHIRERLESISDLGPMIIATTDNPKDNPLVEWAQARRIQVFRGSEPDVLDRYHRAAEKFSLGHVVRVTADNPFTDPEELRRLVEHHLSTGADYTHMRTDLGCPLPIGVGSEMCTCAALEKTWREGTLPRHREHVTPYIYENPGKFRIEAPAVPPEKHAPALRLTMDTPEDLAFFEKLLAGMAVRGEPATTANLIRAASKTA